MAALALVFASSSQHLNGWQEAGGEDDTDRPMHLPACGPGATRCAEIATRLTSGHVSVTQGAP
jgi:hypothetical protein